MRYVTLTRVLTALTILLCAGCGHSSQPLRIGYSDWPGWVAWEVAIEKGWFAEAGVDVQFEWFDYVASMDAFAAGQLDAVAMTNGDTLVTGASGRRAVMLLLNDFSNGNDMIVASPGIEDIAGLKGKRVGVEIGFVGHLLLLQALESAGLTEKDVELVNVPTNETPLVLSSGGVDAIVAWQPNSSQALAALPGSKAIFTSADVPGLIYDTLAVAPESLATRKQDWQRIVEVWYRIVDYLEDPAQREDALEIMAARVGLSGEQYATFMGGTQFLSRAEAQARMLGEGDGLGTLLGSTRLAHQFNRSYGVYDAEFDPAGFVDASFYR
ncbi:MAG: ABC transporter substrate-binding protein [Pseudomonadota bacterium]